MLVWTGLAVLGSQSALAKPPVTGPEGTSKDAPRCRLRITAPRHQSQTTAETTVFVQGKVPPGQYVWVLARRSNLASAGVYWPQGHGKLESLGVWMTTATLGVERDAGHQFDILAISVRQAEHVQLQDYLKDAMTLGKWPPITAPAHTCSTEVTVRRN